MAKRRLDRGGAAQPPAQKRTNNVESVAQGEDVVVSYRVPKTKRVFAGMCGTAAHASTGCSVVVSLKIPRTSTALYNEFLKGGDDVSCTVKFSLTHVDQLPAPTLATKAPFHLAAVQTRLREHLGLKYIVRLYATAQSTVHRHTLSGCLADSIRRVCDLHGPNITCLTAINSTKKQWDGWRSGVYFKKHAYAEVREALLSYIQSNTGCGYQMVMHRAAMEMLAHVGAQFDATIIEALLRLKTGLVRDKFCDLICNEKLRHLCGGGRRASHAIDSTHIAKVMMNACVNFWGATSWIWQQRVLDAVTRPSFAELNPEMGSCCYPAVNFCLQCIDNITAYPDPLHAASQVINFMGNLQCADHAVYRKLIRRISCVEHALVELQCHRWENEPLTLGRDIAAAFDVIVYVFETETFIAGACLIRLIPVESLWPIATALFSDYNTEDTVAACGYPREPTQIFTHIALALIQRDRHQFEPYIMERFQKCGQQAGVWLHRCLEDARKPTKAPEKAKKYTAPVTRGSKRRREAAGAL